jgi:hypothetical protein
MYFEKMELREVCPVRASCSAGILPAVFKSREGKEPARRWRYGIQHRRTGVIWKMRQRSFEATPVRANCLWYDLIEIA